MCRKVPQTLKKHARCMNAIMIIMLLYHLTSVCLTFVFFWGLGTFNMLTLILKIFFLVDPGHLPPGWSSQRFQVIDLEISEICPLIFSLGGHPTIFEVSDGCFYFWEILSDFQTFKCFICNPGIPVMKDPHEIINGCFRFLYEVRCSKGSCTT